MKTTKTEETLKLIRDKGILRPLDLIPYGISRQTLRYLLDRGAIERVRRGLYVAADTEPTEHHSLAEVSKRVPGGIVCLLSALRYHDLTTQNPHQVWIAIGEKTRQPELRSSPIRTARFSGPALEYGVDEHEIEGVTVRVYNPAKTVADCFKYRNKIGLDVALAALRDCWRQRKATMDDLWKAAEVCRVANVMRPYLESLV